MKKTLCLLLVISLVCFYVPLTSLMVSAGTYGTISEDVFANKILQLKNQYPDEKYWNTYNGVDSEGIALAGNKICSGYNHYSGKSCVNEGYCGIRSAAGCSCNCGKFHGWQCHGFANLMAYKIFGSYAISSASNNSGLNSSKGWTYSTSVSEYYAGDFVRINNFGHSIFIYKVEGNTISYVDCNNTGIPCQIDWDKTISVSSLKSKTSYVVHLSGNTLKGVSNSTNQDSIAYSNIAPGNYYIRNKGNDCYLNIANGKDVDKTTIHAYKFGNYDSQVYNIYKSYDGYEMMPLCSNTKVVNPYCWTVESGKTVNLYSRTYENSQCWKFQLVGNGYVIRNAQNPSVCLTPSGGSMIVSEYSGSNNQIWYLEKACNIKYDSNGGSNAPETQRVRAGYKSEISNNLPIKDCNSFLGWSANKNATTVDYKVGDSITVNSDIILYAVWKTSHTFKNWSQTSEPTCTAKGQEVKECSKCTYKEIREIAASGHDFAEWTTKIEPTTQNEGIAERKCRNTSCKYTQTKTIAKLTADGHTHVFGSWQEEQKPTCTTNGTKMRICSICNEKESVVEPSEGHIFNDWKNAKEPSESQNGLAIRNCAICGFKEEKVLQRIDTNTTPEVEYNDLPKDIEEENEYLIWIILGSGGVIVFLVIVTVLIKRKK